MGGRGDESGRSESGRWKKGGKDVMAVVKCGGKGGILEARGNKGGGSRRVWGEETGEL